MKESMPLRSQVVFFTEGSSGRFRGISDQCFCHWAPCSIQLFSASI